MRKIVYLLCCLAGVAFGATPVRNKVVLEVVYDPDGEGVTDQLAPLFEFARAYETHPFVFQRVRKAGLDEIRYTVLSPKGHCVYSGVQRTLAEETVINQLTELPIPGVLCPDLKLVRFKADKAKLSWLGKPLEGFALQKYKDAVRGGGAAGEEAAKILAALEARQRALEEEIAAALTEDPAAALRDMVLYKATWPKQGKEKYQQEILRLKQDAEVLARARALMKQIKRK